MLMASKCNNCERLAEDNGNLETLIWELKEELSNIKTKHILDIEEVKKECDSLMINKIKKYEKKIRELKNHADDMNNYP